MTDTLEHILKIANLAQEAKNNLPEALYPTDIVINLNGPKGNVFAILGICNETALKLGLSYIEILKFKSEALEKEKYEDILNVCQRWFGLIYIRN